MKYRFVSHKARTLASLTLTLFAMLALSCFSKPAQAQLELVGQEDVGISFHTDSSGQLWADFTYIGAWNSGDPGNDRITIVPTIDGSTVSYPGTYYSYGGGMWYGGLGPHTDGTNSITHLQEVVFPSTPLGNIYGTLIYGSPMFTVAVGSHSQYQGTHTFKLTATHIGKDPAGPPGSYLQWDTYQSVTVNCP